MSKVTLEEIAAEAKILNAEKFAIDCKLTKLAQQMEEIKKRDFLATFREIVKPITWAPEFTEDSQNIKLTAWTNTYEEQDAKFELIKELGLSDTVSVFSFPERGCQIHLDYGNLYISCFRVENLPKAIIHYGLNVKDSSGTVKEIDEKIDALNKLKEICNESIKQ